MPQYAVVQNIAIIAEKRAIVNPFFEKNSKKSKKCAARGARIAFPALDAFMHGTPRFTKDRFGAATVTPSLKRCAFFAKGILGCDA